MQLRASHRADRRNVEGNIVGHVRASGARWPLMKVPPPLPVAVLESIAAGRELLR